MNAVDEQGNSALMEASARGHLLVVQSLLAAGADVSLKNKGGRSALDRAKAVNNAAVIAMLEQAGASEGGGD